MSEQDSSDSDIRASDAEREAVVSKLNEAVGEGRLTMDEFSERLERAYASRTRANLEPLLRDLPAGAASAVPAGSATGAVPAAAGTTSGTAVAGGGSLGSDTHWNVSPIGGIRHRGRWRVPRHTVAIGILGGVDVDLSEAELAAPEVMITRVSIIGGARVRVPPGMRVVVSNFCIIGGRDVHLGGPFPPNAPVLRIRSFAVIGGVSVRESGRRRNRDAGD